MLEAFIFLLIIVGIPFIILFMFLTRDPYAEYRKNLPKLTIWKLINHNDVEPFDHCKHCMLTYSGCPLSISNKCNAKSAKKFTEISCPFHRREILQHFS